MALKVVLCSSRREVGKSWRGRVVCWCRCRRRVWGCWDEVWGSFGLPRGTFLLLLGRMCFGAWGWWALHAFFYPRLWGFPTSYQYYSLCSSVRLTLMSNIKFMVGSITVDLKSTSGCSCWIFFVLASNSAIDCSRVFSCGWAFIFVWFGGCFVCKWRMQVSSMWCNFTPSQSDQ